MAHALLHVSRDRERFEQDLTRLNSFKKITASRHPVCESASLAIAPAENGQSIPVEHSRDGKTWIVALGTWLPLPASRGKDTRWLLDTYKRDGVIALSRQIQGIFIIIVGDTEKGCVQVITDRCGSLHVFYRATPHGHAVCTTSAVLAASSPLDPIAAHEFVATGIIYEDRTLFKEVKKLPPATVTTFSEEGKPSFESYWNPLEIAAESISCNDAADALHASLTRVLGALPESSRPLVSDLTGGYDSRLLLAGLLKAGIRFETTVSGKEAHPDVVVAGEIARKMGIRHGHITSDEVLDGNSFLSAVRLTDGEYDAFDYARIQRIHRDLSSRYAMSLNGSFGELARGYWWELLWPRIGKQVPLDVAMIARKRFAAIPYDKSVFIGNANIPLTEHMTAVLERTERHALNQPNTTQLDWAYYTLRMQRWQGRIASSTNQIWQSISPIGFPEVLDPILATEAKGRFGSLLARTVFEKHAPQLARIPLEHGYPPCRATLLNIWKFTPLANYYAKKVCEKLFRRFTALQTPKRTNSRPSPSLRESKAQLFADCLIDDWLEDPVLLETGFFNENRLRAIMDPRRSIGGRALEQWRRLLTLEALLRLLREPAHR